MKETTAALVTLREDWEDTLRPYLAKCEKMRGEVKATIGVLCGYGNFLKAYIPEVCSEEGNPESCSTAQKGLKQTERQMRKAQALEADVAHSCRAIGACIKFDIKVFKTVPSMDPLMGCKQ